MSYPAYDPADVVYLDEACEQGEFDLERDAISDYHAVVVDTRTGIAYTRGYREHLHPSELVGRRG